jgi:hypothetical protein
MNRPKLRTRTKRNAQQADVTERTRSRQTGISLVKLDNKQPTADTIDRIFGHKAPWCACGCGAEVRKGARFKPGHDARLRPGSQWRKDHPDLGGGHGPNS